MCWISFFVAWGALAASGAAATAPPPCSSNPATLHLSDSPYDNFFYSDCNTAVQVVVSSPNPNSNLTLLAPRLIVAWPAGNSGVAAYFAPQNGINGSLAISVVNSTIGNPLAPTYYRAPGSANGSTPFVGVTGTIRFNAPSLLTIPILGSIRTIRDFVEGPSLLVPEIQNAIQVSGLPDGGASLHRLWLDNVTTTHLNFTPVSGSGQPITVGDNQTLKFEAGDYVFAADLNYAQLTQLAPTQVLGNSSWDLIKQQPETTTALSFLSYSSKLLAGAWRFLTYFGRDSMISALLMEPILSTGEHSAMEAVIAAVLERLNQTDGSVCHEETIGDYATYQNELQNIASTAARNDYHMIDTDYYLPILMNNYFILNPVGQSRTSAFLSIIAGETNPTNTGLSYGKLAVINADRIMRLAAPFAGEHNQTKDNLIHLKDGETSGEWRDSSDGIGGGRIPYDVNAALVPAALRAIASLSRSGFYANRSKWSHLADQYAQVWEDETLRFFEVTVPQAEAEQLVSSYATAINFTGPNQTNTIDGDVHFHALALDGSNNQSQVAVMNTDDCFRHFLLNTTGRQDQLTAFVNQTANNIRRTFPAGLLTGAGMLVANPAYSRDPEDAEDFSNGAYHGTVIWSWPLAMMAKGLEQQLGRCPTKFEHGVAPQTNMESNGKSTPHFCEDPVVFNNVKTAYNLLWDSIGANTQQLSQELWSWAYNSSTDTFEVVPLAVVPAPGGASQTGMS